MVRTIQLSSVETIKRTAVINNTLIEREVRAGSVDRIIFSPNRKKLSGDEEGEYRGPNKAAAL